MGVLTRYLDLLPTDARNRVLTAREWTAAWHVDESGARNLLGHAENWTWPHHSRVPRCGEPAIFELRTSAGDELWTDEPLIGGRFERLVRRRGMQAAISLIQARLQRETVTGAKSPSNTRLMLVK